MYRITVQRTKDFLTENLSFDNLNTLDWTTAENHLWTLCQKYGACGKKFFNITMLEEENPTFYGILNCGLVKIQMSVISDISYYKWHVNLPTLYFMPFISINVSNEKGGAEIQINWRNLNEIVSPEFSFFEEGLQLMADPRIIEMFTELSKLPNFSPEECETVLVKLGFQDNTPTK